MRTIYKYTIPISKRFEVTVPYDSKFLSVKRQGTNICAWYEVDKENKNREFRNEYFSVYLTGDNIDDVELVGFEFADTITFNDGSFIIHVYRDGK